MCLIKFTVIFPGTIDVFVRHAHMSNLTYDAVRPLGELSTRMVQDTSTFYYNATLVTCFSALISYAGPNHPTTDGDWKISCSQSRVTIFRQLSPHTFRGRMGSISYNNYNCDHNVHAMRSNDMSSISANLLSPEHCLPLQVTIQIDNRGNCNSNMNIHWTTTT